MGRKKAVEEGWPVEGAVQPAYVDAFRTDAGARVAFTIMPNNREIKVVAYYGDLNAHKTVIVDFKPGWNVQAKNELDTWRNRVSPK